MSNNDDGAYLQPMIPNAPPDNQEEYEYVRNSETETSEKPYMNLDASSRQPDLVYQEVTNPENLKEPDMYPDKDLKSSIADSKCRALGPQNSEPTYDTAM